MAYNPQHLRRTWLALGNPGDPVAFDVAGDQSAISLLKGILAEFGFPFIPLHSISFDKLQQVVGPTVLGRGGGLGEVLALGIGRGLEIVGTLTAPELRTTADVPMKSEHNFWLGQNTFQNAVNVPDGDLGFKVYNAGDTTRILRFDLSTMPTGNTLKVRMPTVGMEGSGEVGTLALLKGTEGAFFAQPRDDDLTALSALTAVDTLYYRRADNPPLWAPVVIGANLVFNAGTLSATGGGGGGGGVSTAGPVDASKLAAFADASGTLIQGVTVSGPGITYASGLLQTTGDLLALENLTGTNTIYFRAADSVWLPVNISTGLTFGSGVLAVVPALAAFIGLASVADTVPYFTGPNAAALTAFTTFGRSLVGTADAAAARTLIGAQPLDDDLTAISALGGANTIYYRSGAGAWSPVTIGANLTFTSGTLAATGGGGGVSTSGAVTAAMLTGYADATGLVIRGVTLPGAGLTLVGSALTLANDLSALEALTGVNTIYYRSGTDAWSPVTFSGLTFTGGVLAVSGGGGGVTTSGAVTASMLTGYADATGNLIRGINLPAAGIALSGNNMVLTNDLASLESASSTGAIYYRSAADTWSTVTVGGGLGFTGPNLTITNVALTALAALTPAADRLPYFNSATTAALAVFTAAGRTLVSQPDAASMVGILGAQPLDADLTSLAGATGTNTIYYRSAANTWTPVVVGTNLTFAGGTLAATGGGGDVFKNLANTFTAQNAFINVGVVIGNATPIDAVGLEVHGMNSTLSAATFSEWSNNAAATSLALNKSRGATPGVHAAGQAGDSLGVIMFNASNGSSFAVRAQISAALATATAARLGFWTHDGSSIAERVRIWPSGGVSIGNLTLDKGAGGLAVNVLNAVQLADNVNNGVQITNAAGTGFMYQYVAGNTAIIAVQGGTTGLSIANNNLPVNLANFLTTGCQFKASTGTSSPPSGYMGEYVVFDVSPGSALAGGAYTNCMVQNIGAGDWDITGIVQVSGAGIGSTLYLNVHTGVGSSGSPISTQTGILSANNDCWTCTAPVRFLLSATTAIYINVYMSNAGGILQRIIMTCRRRI